MRWWDGSSIWDIETTLSAYFERERLFSFHTDITSYLRQGFLMSFGVRHFLWSLVSWFDTTIVVSPLLFASLYSWPDGRHSPNVGNVTTMSRENDSILVCGTWVNNGAKIDGIEMSTSNNEYQDKTFQQLYSTDLKTPWKISNHKT